MSSRMKGIAGGPLLGIFLLGICTRRASAGGALCGGVIGAVAMGAISAAKYSCRPPTDGGGGSGCPEWLEVVGSLSVFLYATFGTAITLAVGYSASLLVWPNTAEERAALTGLCYGDHMMNDGGKYEAQQEERGRRKQAQGRAKGQVEGEGEGLRASLLGAGEGGGQQQQQGRS
jgi:Na+/proline symporter